MIIEEYLIGKVAKARHPITVINPTETFVIKEVKVESRSDGHVIQVRGENTSWFGKNYWDLVN